MVTDSVSFPHTVVNIHRDDHLLHSFGSGLLTVDFGDGSRVQVWAGCLRGNPVMLACRLLRLVESEAADLLAKGDGSSSYSLLPPGTPITAKSDNGVKFYLSKDLGSLSLRFDDESHVTIFYEHAGQIGAADDQARLDLLLATSAFRLAWVVFELSPMLALEVV